MGQRQNKMIFCKLHNKRIVQLGSCISCTSSAQICQAKGCIKFHSQLQSVHNVHTVEYIRHVIQNYAKTDINKKAQLKKMIHQYFLLAKQELQNLFNQIYDSVDKFKFENVILHEQEQKVVNMLFKENFAQVTCCEVAMIIPKLIKCSNFQDGHFVHLRNYLRMEKEKIPTIFNSMILNLPYFRLSMVETLQQKAFCQLSSDWLRQVNFKMEKLSYKPKKIVIKYIDDEVLYDSFRDKKNKRQFVKNLRQLETLNEVQSIQIYCTWNINQLDRFQDQVFEALLRFPFLASITIITMFKVTGTSHIQARFNDRNVEVKVFKKQWHF